MAVDTTTQVTMPAMGESVTEGTVLTWVKQEGDHVEADETIVEISTDKVDAEVPAPASGAPAPAAAPDAPTAAAAPVRGGGDITPVAARVAAAEGIDVSKVTGTGPRGRITKADVLSTNGHSAAAANAETLKGGAAMLARYM